MNPPSLVTLANKYRSTTRLVGQLEVYYPHLKVKDSTHCSRPDLINALVGDPEYRDTVYELLSYCSNWELSCTLSNEMVVEWFIERYREGDLHMTDFFDVCDSSEDFDVSRDVSGYTTEYVLLYVDSVVTPENENEIYERIHNLDTRMSTKFLGMYASENVIREVGVSRRRPDEFDIDYMFRYALKVSKERLVTVIKYALPLTYSCYNQPSHTYGDGNITEIYEAFVRAQQKYNSECFATLRLFKEEYKIADDDLSDNTKTKLALMYKEQV